MIVINERYVIIVIIFEENTHLPDLYIYNNNIYI